MKKTGIITIFAVFCAALSGMLETASAYDEFVITDVTYQAAFDGIPYTFEDRDWENKWKNLGGTVFYEADGVMCAGFTETSNLGTQMGAYVVLIDNFTEEDYGTYSISCKVRPNKTKFCDYALAGNNYKGNSKMGGRKEMSANVWHEMSGELTITEDDAKNFLNKPLYLHLYSSEDKYTSQKFTERDYRVEFDDVVVTKNSDTAQLKPGRIVVGPKLMSKKASAEGKFTLKANLYDASGDMISGETLGDFAYPSEVRLPLDIEYDDAAEAGIYVEDSDGNIVSDEVKIKRFYKNGKNIMFNSGFENEEMYFNAENADAKISSDEAFEGNNSLVLAPLGTQAGLVSSDISELISEYGTGEYLAELRCKSGSDTAVKAVMGNTSDEDTAHAGEWEYMSFLLSVSDDNVKEVKFSFEQAEAENIYIDNFTLKKVMDY